MGPAADSLDHRACVRIWPYKCEHSGFGAKSGAKLAELAEWSGASIANESGGRHPQNQNANQVGVSQASNARKLSIKLDYVLDLLDYAGMSNVLNNTFIV